MDARLVAVFSSISRMRALLSACLLTVLLSACGSAQSGEPKTDRTACKVLQVFDGDTLACDLNHNGKINKPREYIRLLGIDAPETRYSRRGDGEDEPYAVEATDFLAKKTLGKTVYLEWDRERRDPYDRSLAFIHLRPDSTESVNAMLVKRGYASTLFIPPNGKYRDEFETLETQARQQRLGIWNPTP